MNYAGPFTWSNALGKQQRLSFGPVAAALLCSHSPLVFNVSLTLIIYAVKGNIKAHIRAGWAFQICFWVWRTAYWTSTSVLFSLINKAFIGEGQRQKKKIGLKKQKEAISGDLLTAVLAGVPNFAMRTNLKISQRKWRTNCKGQPCEKEVSVFSRPTWLGV